ncbi:MAG: hypothetical protein HYZ84_01295 [Candidatus Omnitrophica bacterium]|nr:hypothetical protein [Candidatus Omnitrophota bacterium]
MKKFLARLALLLIVGLLGFGIYCLVVGIQGPEDTIEGNLYTQKKYHFKLNIPGGWLAEKPKDRGMGRLYIKKYGAEPPSMTNPGAYLPLVAVNYVEIDSSSKNPIKRQMEAILSDVKSEPELYRALNVLTEQTGTAQNFDAVGTLVYSFRGALGRAQRTEVRYYLKRNLLIWFALADIDKVFNNTVLNQLASSLRFD